MLHAPSYFLVQLQLKGVDMPKKTKDAQQNSSTEEISLDDLNVMDPGATKEDVQEEEFDEGELNDIDE